MNTPKDSKVDDTNTNQADSMKELITTQNQLNQLTAQFIANNSDKDPALQKFLEEQSQLMLKVTNQMISMEENYPKRVNDNKDDKNVILDGAPVALFVETRIILPRSMKVNALTVKKIIPLDNVPPLKPLV